VLNADDPHCLRMADYTSAAHLCYVTMSIEHPLVKEHIRAGGRAVGGRDARPAPRGGPLPEVTDGGAMEWTTVIGQARAARKPRGM